MSETTQDDRDAVLNNTFHPDSPVLKCARDADRLAAIERSVRVVEHRLTMAPEHDYSREQAIKDLRAILDPEGS